MKIASVFSFDGLAPMTVVLSAALGLVGCEGSEASLPGQSSDPTAGSAGSDASGAAGNGAGGTAAAGAGGTGGDAGGTAAAGAGGTGGGAGGSMPAAGGGIGIDAGEATGAGAGGTGGNAGDGGVAAGCAGKGYPVCLDFESGNLDQAWTTNATNATVESGNAAHGKYALHLSGFQQIKSTLIHTAQLGAIKDVMWGRYYLYMDPGAPTGHGAMLRAFDERGDWYELGFEFNSFLGNWHPAMPNPGSWTEKAMRSHNVIPGKQWVCVEFLLDGATPDVTQIWYGGQKVTYYSVISYCSNKPATCDITLSKAVQFKSFDIGTDFYHGISLDPTMWAGNGPPIITDVWIDDVALDSKRIGCL